MPRSRGGLARAADCTCASDEGLRTPREQLAEGFYEIPPNYALDGTASGKDEVSFSAGSRESRCAAAVGTRRDLACPGEPARAREAAEQVLLERNGSNPIACRALPTRRHTQQPPAVRETRRRRACGLRARSLDPAARARAAEPLLGLSRRPPLTDFAHLCALLRSSQARVRPVGHLPGRIFRRGKFWHDRSDTPDPPRPKNADLKMSSKSDLPYASESPLTGPNLILPAPPCPS